MSNPNPKQQPTYIIKREAVEAGLIEKGMDWIDLKKPEATDSHRSRGGCQLNRSAWNRVKNREPVYNRTVQTVAKALELDFDALIEDEAQVARLVRTEGVMSIEAEISAVFPQLHIGHHLEWVQSELYDPENYDNFSESGPVEGFIGELVWDRDIAFATRCTAQDLKTVLSSQVVTRVKDPVLDDPSVGAEFEWESQFLQAAVLTYPDIKLPREALESLLELQRLVGEMHKPVTVLPTLHELVADQIPTEELAANLERFTQTHKLAIYACEVQTWAKTVYEYGYSQNINGDYYEFTDPAPRIDLHRETRQIIVIAPTHLSRVRVNYPTIRAVVSSDIPF